MAAELYGRPLDEAGERMGSIAQAVSLESSVVTDGPSAGTRRLRLVAGDLDLDLLPDRGLDIGQARIGGVPLAWISPTGFPRLSSFDADRRGWLRAFGGGLLTTCGLLNVGPPARDGDIEHPMHGRYSSLPAQVVRAEVVDDAIVVEGIIRETSVFGADLELRRRISVPIGARSIRVDDVVVNRGAEPVEPMVLYHVNFGWPLIDEGTLLRSPAREVVPRDADADVGAKSWSTFPAPSHPYPEQVFAHVLPESGPQDARPLEVSVVHPRGLAAHVRFDATELRGLFQWRVADSRFSVLGVEPALIPTIRGRADARERGLLRPLAPGASLELGVEIAVTGSLG